MTRIAINGFGRMGRLFLRAAWGRSGLDIVHINDPGCDAATSAHLLAFDSVHGRWRDDQVAADGDAILVDGQRITYGQASSPAEVALDHIDLVVECSGRFKSSGTLQPYLDRGVAKILVSAPVKEDGVLDMVYGVNHDTYDPAAHAIVTAASCTTNCLAPVVQVVHEGLGIERACMTTIHDITNTQVLVDAPHKDLRRARAAGQSLIPTTTGSATAITRIFPDLVGRIDGHAVRVPLLNASLTDVVFQVRETTDVQAVNNLFRDAAAGPLRGILGYEERPLVSCDFKDDPRSSIVDAPSTMVTDGQLVKVFAWYDNEWGYVNRMADIAAMIHERR